MKIYNGKKLIILVLAIALLVVACSNKPKDAGSSANDELVIGISQLMDHSALNDARLGFEEGLKELGVNAKIVYQNAQGDLPTSLSIAEKLVKDQVDLIYAIATPAAQAAKQATKEIPILFSAVTDPVKAGIVDDWEGVGGNITGTSDKAPVDLQLKIFKEIDPTIEKIGVVYNTSEANSEIQLDEVMELAPAEGLEVVAMGVTSSNDLAQVMDSLLNRVDGVYGLSDNLVASSIGLVANKLIEKEMLSVFAEESQVNGGGLISKGFSYYELGRQTAKMAKEILVDKKHPSQIPVGLPEKIDTIVNIKTLEALNLDIDSPLFKDAIIVGED